MVMILGLWKFWQIYDASVQTQKLYTQLAEDAKAVEETEEKSGQSFLTQLQKQNEELVGWIRIPGTAIDYPVMQTKEDNDYYLTHDFSREENAHGTPFLDVNCDIENSQNLIIYGHNMKDKSMFQNLMQYKDAQFCEENPVIELKTLQGSEEYRLLFVLTMSVEEMREFPYYTYIDMEDETYEEFIRQCTAYATWLSSEDLPATGTKLLTLSTCEYSRENGRLAVIARKIDSK